MEMENQSTFISQMLQELQAGVDNEETASPVLEESVTPMTIDKAAPGDVIELSDEFDFEGYQVVRREFFAHTFEPSITFNNYKVYVNTACLNKFPHADCAQLLINRDSHILRCAPVLSQNGMHSLGVTHLAASGNPDRSQESFSLQKSIRVAGHVHRSIHIHLCLSGRS